MKNLTDTEHDNRIRRRLFADLLRRMKKISTQYKNKNDYLYARHYGEAMGANTMAFHCGLTDAKQYRQIHNWISNWK